MSLTVEVSQLNIMAPVENSLSGGGTSRSPDSNALNSITSTSDDCEAACLNYLAESLGQMQLNIGISTKPCQHAASMNKKLLNMMSGMQYMTLGGEPATLNDSVRANQKMEAKLKSHKPEIKTKNSEAELKLVESEAAKSCVSIEAEEKNQNKGNWDIEVKTENGVPEEKSLGTIKTKIKPDVDPLNVVKCEVGPTGQSDLSGELIARGPDRNRSRDVHHHPYLQSSSSSSSPESLADLSSPEGSPSSIVFDHRRQSGGSITLCRQPPGKFDVPEPAPVTGRVQNQQHTYRHKSGGGAIQVFSTNVISIPNNQQLMDSSHGACYTTSPAHYSMPSPPNAFSPSHSPFQNVISSPSQIISAARSPGMYRDLPCQSSPESFSAHSPAQESMPSPFPNSPMAPGWGFGNSTSLSDQLDDFCFTSQTNEILLPSASPSNDGNQVVPGDVYAVNSEQLSEDFPSELEQFISYRTQDEVAPAALYEEKLNEIMSFQDQSSSLSNTGEFFLPSRTELNEVSGSAASVPSTVSVPMPASTTQNIKITSSQTSTFTVNSSNMPNNHPLLTDILNHSSPDVNSPRTPVSIVLNTGPATELWIPSTVNPGGTQVVPVSMQIYTTPARKIGRPKTRTPSGTKTVPRTIMPRLIAPKPDHVAQTSPVASPSTTDERSTPAIPVTLEDIHAKLLEPFDVTARRKMNQRVQAISDDKLFLIDPARGDTVAHIAIETKSVLLSVNLIDRFVQKSPSKLNLGNHLGHTLLLSAAMTRQETLVEYLLLRGADPNKPVSSYGSTVLHYLAERGGSFAGVLDKVCSFPGALLNKRNCDGRTPLLSAVESHGREIITAEKVSITIDAIPVICVLLRRGASLAVPCLCAGKTALHLAVQKKNFLLAQVLCLENPRIRDDISLQAFDGNTALHYASGMSEWDVESQSKMVKLLLQYGASTMETNNESKIPADYVDKGRKEVKKLLKPAGGRRGSAATN